MGLKGPVSYFRRSMSNTVMTDLVYHICELYIDDVLIHGGDPATFLAREFKYVGHVISKPLSAAKKHLQLPETLLP